MPIETRQTSVRFTNRQCIVFRLGWLIAWLAYEFRMPPQDRLSTLWFGPFFSGLLWSSFLLFVWPPLWKQARFWVAVAVGLAVQIPVEQAWLRNGKPWWSGPHSGRNFPSLGLLVWGLCYLYLLVRHERRRFREDDQQG